MLALKKDWQGLRIIYASSVWGVLTEKTIILCLGSNPNLPAQESETTCLTSCIDF